MYKLLISDLDGTLLKRGQTALSGSAFEMIEAVLRHGCAFAVASGRPYHDLKRFFAHLADRIYFICSDGAVTVYGGRVLHSTPIPPERLSAVFETLRQSGRQALFMGLEGSCALGCIPPEGGADAPVSVSTGFELDKPVYKIAVYGRPLLDYPPGLARVYQDRRWQEWAALGTDKGTAALSLQKQLGISAADCCAFGDGENDLGLLRRSAGRYVMSHAAPQVKRAATQIIDGVEPVVTQLISGQ